ncbi:MAG: sialidase family protein [Gammaproteobacteria bacterium]|jgi:hypothetical protein|nr:hypothetical protein [Chromatiales bacterium]MDP6673771.1 sialidase family protein [Gammaproteobacteria bacterium]
MTRLKPLTQWMLLGTVAIAAALLESCIDRDNTKTVFEIISVTSPAAPGSLSPHLAVTPSGTAVLSWLEPAGSDAHAVRYSLLQDNSWSAPQSVAEDQGWFVNWADFPSVVPLTAQQWVAHWLVKKPGGTYAYDIALANSADRGANWTRPLTPHTDNTPTEHGFVTLFPWSSGIGAVWLDGRNMVPDNGGKQPADNDKKYGGMTLRFAHFGYDGKILTEGEIDNLVCDCCQTDAAITASGPVVAYRDRTSAEIRDISVTRYVDNGWAKPVTISDDQWHIPGCPVNGPAIAADGQRVVVAWYGAPHRESRVKLAWSQDAGQTFSAPVIVAEAGVKGRVDVVLLSNDSALVSWMSKSDDGNGQVRMRQVTSDGQTGPIQLIAEGKYSRNSGFPQMVKAGDQLVFAWPEPGEPKQILTAFSYQ